VTSIGPVPNWDPIDTPEGDVRTRELALPVHNPNLHHLVPINTMVHTDIIEPGAIPTPIEPGALPTLSTMPIAAPIPTTKLNSPSGMVRPISNSLTGNGPRPSGANNSPNAIENPPQPSASVQNIPQALNDEDEGLADEFETTTLISVENGTTLTIVTGGPRRITSISTSSGTQPYTVPAVT
jgi:hypothetical protein